MKQIKTLNPELRKCFRNTMELLFLAYEKKVGKHTAKTFSELRKQMQEIRGEKTELQSKALLKITKNLEKLNSKEQMDLAYGFSLYMEVSNLCENAYRSYRWKDMDFRKISFQEDSRCTWVFTAHPTESRDRKTVQLYHQIQKTIADSFSTSFESEKDKLSFLFQLLVQSPLSPKEKPIPEDEAKTIYDLTLRLENLDAMFSVPDLAKFIRFRSWAGGDKDGHPGVNETVFLHSLQLSRQKLCDYLEFLIKDFEKKISLSGMSFNFKKIYQEIKIIRELKKGDQKRVHRFKTLILNELSSFSLYFEKVKSCFEMFPSLVMPLEFREDSEEIRNCVASKNKKIFPIFRMLSLLRDLSLPGFESEYVQAFVVSMTHASEDLLAAEKLKKTVSQKFFVPVVPLFETEFALKNSSSILEGYLKQLKNRVVSQEVMLGYSDSSKESGVLKSRTLIQETISKLESFAKKRKIKITFFHGSGGSVARGGGNFKDQMSPWSKEVALRYKLTLQGETVSRTFSSPEILMSNFYKIAEAQNEKHKKSDKIPEVLKLFSTHVQGEYQSLISDPDFLDFVQKHTLYPFLSELKIGSRPSKRKSLNSVSDLRAIPWVLCWTQSRTLMPTWWGVGSAWEKMSATEKKEIKKLVRKKDPFFNLFLRQLRFSLQKVELASFWMMLEFKNQDNRFSKWESEFAKTKKAIHQITGEKDLLSYQPWLKESIWLRSTMIHPLNILQMIAIQKNDLELLRLTVTGIASGMLTTG